jgi:hypothetical protein
MKTTLTLDKVMEKAFVGKVLLEDPKGLPIRKHINEAYYSLNQGFILVTDDHTEYSFRTTQPIYLEG